MPTTVSSKELYDQFAKLGRIRNISEPDMALNEEYWTKHPEKCHRCQGSKDHAICSPREECFGCESCIIHRTPCSKKEGARIYVLSQRYRIPEQFIQGVITMATDSSYLVESDDEDEGRRSIARMRLEEARERLKVTERDVEDLNRREIQLRSQNEKSSEQIKKLIRKLDSKNEELDQVNLEMESANYANARLEEGYDDMTNKVQSLNTALEYWRKKAEETSDDNTLEMQRLRDEVESLKKTLTERSISTEEERTESNFLSVVLCSDSEKTSSSHINECSKMEESVVESKKDSTELEKPGNNASEKMREGVVELTKFTCNVLAGLASLLLALEGINGMLSKTSTIQGKRTLKMMETELRNLNKEASELYMIATTLLHDPESVNWKST
ncbi:hypothetical protein BDQ17DRAFT_1425678 [Cyathus striatus]|nr:hypothetical protein BDQ17DRAFT_1425678 [Cyathus striatus]